MDDVNRYFVHAISLFVFLFSSYQGRTKSEITRKSLGPSGDGTSTDKAAGAAAYRQSHKLLLPLPRTHFAHVTQALSNKGHDTKENLELPTTNQYIYYSNAI